jgi:hypothetical protein
LAEEVAKIININITINKELNEVKIKLNICKDAYEKLIIENEKLIRDY